MTDAGDIKPYLLAEFDQAWTHYRHVESMRTQYLGFFFTISLGSTALAVPTVSADALDDPSRPASFAVFLWVFSVVASFHLRQCAEGRSRTLALRSGDTSCARTVVYVAGRRRSACVL
jgi:hypothetical protein